MNYTLVTDGPSDANLMPIIDWTLRSAGGVDLPNGTRAEFWRLPERPASLKARIAKAIELFPCEIIFIHRDAERDEPAVRNREIQGAVEAAAEGGCQLPAIAVIPVRRLEAWLLFDEGAIRSAAGNPNGRTALALPGLRVEGRPDPKDDLKQALQTASELTGRRLKKFPSKKAFWRVVDCIDDFTPLRNLRAFQAFEATVRRVAQANWLPGFYGLETDNTE